MKKILAINIDTISLNIISSLLTGHSSDFEILTSSKIGEIDSIVKKLTTDIIIIDLVSPSPQDLKILGSVSKNHPRLPLIVMTAFETGEIQSAIKAISTIRSFEKPVDLKEIVDVVWEKIERSVGGEIHGISLTSFLQMSEMEKTSCTLKIKAAEKTGALYLLKGSLIAAEAGELENDEAVFEILSWENPAIEIDDTPVNRKKEIQAPLISILMESVRRKDEKKADKKSAPGKKAEGGKKSAIVSSSERIKEIGSVLAEAEKKALDTETVPPGDEALTTSAKITDASKVLKRQQLISQVSKILAAVLIIVAVACIWQFVINPWQAKKKYNNAMADAKSAQSTKEKISILNAYLSSAPDGKYAAQVKAMKGSYVRQVETQAFDQTIQAVNDLPLDENFQEAAKATYLKFSEEFPDSAFKDQIRKRIDDIPSMMDDAEYAGLKSIPENHYTERLTAYQTYLSRHPDSTNTDNVRRMMANLGQDFYEHIKTEKNVCDSNESWAKGIKLCQYFLDNFKQHERTDEITAMQRDMASRAAYVKVAEQVEKEGALSEAAETLLKDYLKEYPASPVRETVEAQLANICQNKNQEKDWQQLLDYVKNDRNNIFDRVDRMACYLNQQPPESHVDDAQNIYAWLVNEKEKELKKMNQQAEAEKMRRQQELRIEQEKRAIISKIKQSGGRFSVIKDGTITDNQTGLTWCMLDSSILSNNCMDYKSAKQYVNHLNTGGYNDWRLPEPSELLVLYNSKSGFPLSNARWYWTSEAFYAAWKEKVNTVIRTDTGLWKKAETDLNKCGAVRAVRP